MLNPADPAPASAVAAPAAAAPASPGAVPTAAPASPGAPAPSFPLVPVPTTAAVPAPAVDLVSAFLSGRSAQTLRAYRSDLESFRAWLGVATVDAAARALLSRNHGEANRLALAYRAHLIESGLAPNTINRKLAGLRSLAKLARCLGWVPWGLEVPGVRSENYRDTAGPGAAGVRKLLGQLDGRAGPQAVRDRCIVRLAYDLGLRRAEITRLDLADVDLAAGVVWVLGKGRSEKAKLTLPDPTAAALRAWLEVRGREPGPDASPGASPAPAPLFIALAPPHRGHRLTGHTVYRIVRQLGEAAGVRARPHGIRHAAVTAVLDLSGGDVRAARKFSRHSSLETVLKYDDNRADMAGQFARRLAAGV